MYSKDKCKEFQAKLVQALKDRPIVIERYYNDEYMDPGEAEKLFNDLKVGNEDMLLRMDEDIYEGSLASISESMDVAYDSALDNVANEMNVDLQEMEQSFIEYDMDWETSEYIHHMSVDIDILSWLPPEIMGVYIIGEINLMRGKAIDVENGFVKWINMAGHTLEEFITVWMANAIPEQEAEFLNTNSVTDFNQLYTKFPDLDLNSEKVIDMDKIIEIIINAGYGGELYFGVNIDKNDWENLAKGHTDFEIPAVAMGIHAWWRGSGMYNTFRKEVTVPIKDCQLDVSGYTIQDVFGIDSW